MSAIGGSNVRIGFRSPFTLAQRYGITDDRHSEDAARIRQSHRTCLDDQFVRYARRELAAKTDNFPCLRHGEENSASEHWSNLVQTVFERSHHAQVTSAAAHAEVTWAWWLRSNTEATTPRLPPLPRTPQKR